MCSLQLGEQAEWDKYTSYQVSHRAPVMLHVPGLVDQATFSAELVEFVDIFPSLVEAAGLPPLHKCPVNSRNVSLCREGMSLLGLVSECKFEMENYRVHCENWPVQIFRVRQPPG